MKILTVIPALGDIYGGPSKCIIELAQAIANSEINIDVDIVTTNVNGYENLDVPLHSWITQKNCRVQYFPHQGWSGYAFSFSLTFWLFNHVADYDLVHTNALFCYPPLPAHWACQLHKIPYIMTPHGMLEPWALNYKAHKKRFYYNLLEKPALNNASSIQMLTFTEAKNAKGLQIKAPFVTVPNGINRQDFANLANPEIFYARFSHTRGKKLLIFLGRIDPKKGLDLLAEAFAKVYQQFPSTHLVIAGPDNIGFLPTANNYFTQAGCEGGITFTGMLTGELKYAALAAASLYVAPSYSEGFSLSILEGMVAGLACVITTGCNFPEAAAAKAVRVVPIDAQKIAEALIQYLKYPQQAKLTGEKARQFIFKHYTWDSIAHKMISIYQTIIENK